MSNRSSLAAVGEIDAFGPGEFVGAEITPVTGRKESGCAVRQCACTGQLINVLNSSRVTRLEEGACRTRKTHH